jgi:hypothetical protein
MSEKVETPDSAPENSATSVSPDESQKPKEDAVTDNSTKTPEKELPPKKSKKKKKSTAPKAVSTPKVSTSKNFVVNLTDIELPEKWNRDAPGNLGSLTTSLKTIGATWRSRI